MLPPKYQAFFSILNEIIELVVPRKTTGPKICNVRVPAPIPWWNKKCSDTVDVRRNLCRIYKANPTLDNWNEYRRETVRCRRTLRREKRLGWRKLCSSFSSKTPTANIWRFIRAYKKKSLKRELCAADDRALTEKRNLIVDKLCPSSCLLLPTQSAD